VNGCQARHGAAFTSPLAREAGVFRNGSIGELTRERPIGFSTSSWVFPSYIAIDQKAFTGGSWPGANAIA
jgi:hypothetical protein